MRIDRIGLVTPFEHRRVRGMIGIEADARLVPGDMLAIHPGKNHAELGRAIAILAIDPRDDAIVEAGQAIGGDHVVKAQLLRDRFRIEAI